MQDAVPGFVQKIFSIFILVHVVKIGLAQYPPAAGSDDLLKGAVDFHVHSSPDAMERSVTDGEAAAQAQRRGFSAIVIKNHLSETASRAALASMANTGIKIYGGVVLNRSVGGINFYAVEAMHRLSPQYGKVVWFPTVDAQAHLAAFSLPGNGLSVLLDGKLTQETIRILTFIAEKKLVLATGHLSPNELMVLIPEAASRGVKKILITHALSDTPALSDSQIRQLMAFDVYFELTLLSNLSGPQSHLPYLKNAHHVPIAQMATLIKNYGAEKFILSTDLGQSGNPAPADGMKLFLNLLQSAGITSEEITTMVSQNPLKLLD